MAMNVRLSQFLIVCLSVGCTHLWLIADAACAEPDLETRRSEEGAELQISDAKELDRLDVAWQYSLKHATRSEKLDLALAWFSGFCTSEIGCVPPEDWVEVLKRRAVRKLRLEDQSGIEVKETQWPSAVRTDIGGKVLCHDEKITVRLDELTGTASARRGETVLRDLSFVKDVEPTLVYLSIHESKSTTIVVVRSRLIEDTYQVGVIDGRTQGLKWVSTGTAASNRHSARGQKVIFNEDTSYSGLNVSVCRSKVVVFGWSQRDAFVDVFDLEDGNARVRFCAKR